MLLSDIYFTYLAASGPGNAQYLASNAIMSSTSVVVWADRIGMGGILTRLLTPGENSAHQVHCKSFFDISNSSLCLIFFFIDPF